MDESKQSENKEEADITIEEKSEIEKREEEKPVEEQPEKEEVTGAPKEEIKTEEKKKVVKEPREPFNFNEFCSYFSSYFRNFNFFFSS